MSAMLQIALSKIIDTSQAVKTTDAAIAAPERFDPEGIDSLGVATWCNRAGDKPVGYPRLSLQVRKPSKVSRNYKVTVKLLLPTLDITSPSTGSGIQPAPTKAYDNSMILEAILPERGTAAERLALFSQFASLFFPTITASDASPSDATASPLLKAIRDLEPVF